MGSSQTKVAPCDNITDSPIMVVDTDSNNNIIVSELVKTICCVCHTDLLKLECALEPCGHCAICIKCVNLLKNKKCPICNTPNIKILRLYY